MAIVAMKKLSLMTFHRHRGALLRRIQQFGEVHLRRLDRDEALAALDFVRGDFAPEQAAVLEQQRERVKLAIAALEPVCPPVKGGARPPRLGVAECEDFHTREGIEALCDAILALDQEQAALKAELARLQTENESLQTWAGLDAAPGEYARLSSVHVVLGTVNATVWSGFQAAAESAYPLVYLEPLGARKGDMAVFAMLPAETSDEIYAYLRENGFTRVTPGFSERPAERIEANGRQAAQTQAQLADTQARMAQYADALGTLKTAADCLQIRLTRETVRENVMRTDTVILMEGWFPADTQPVLEALLTEVCGDEYCAEFAEVCKDSPDIPVKLRNNKLVSAFEDVTTMYATPRYNEIDPTPLFMPFYWLFFGFMVGDTGFGLLLCAGTALALRFAALKDGMRRFLLFFHYLSYGVIAAGFVYGSLFGFAFFTPVPVYDAAGVLTGYKPILDAMTDIPAMLLLAVAIGVVQVIFGLCLRGYLLWRDGKPLDAVFDAAFWIVTLLGGIGYLLSAAGTVTGLAADICRWCFWGGLGALVLTQGRAGQSIGGKIGMTLWNVYGISGYVGDLISYTRIVALALSGSFIGFSFIKMASILPPGPVRWTVGFVIVLAGQALNLGLGLLGAYVHTCRLQYVEYFGKFYEGGGVPFQPFKAQGEYAKFDK